MVTYEPILTQSIEKGNGHKIFDTSQLPGVSVGVYAFRQDFVKNRPEDVQKFVAVWRKTADFIKTNPDEAYGIIAQIYGAKKEDVAAFAKQDQILDWRDNKTAFSYAAGLDSFHGLARNVESYLQKEGLLKQNIDSTQYLNARFIRALDR